MSLRVYIAQTDPPYRIVQRSKYHMVNLNARKASSKINENEQHFLAL